MAQAVLSRHQPPVPSTGSRCSVLRREPPQIRKQAASAWYGIASFGPPTPDDQGKCPGHRRFHEVTKSSEDPLVRDLSAVVRKTPRKGRRRSTARTGPPPSICSPQQLPSSTLPPSSTPPDSAASTSPTSPLPSACAPTSTALLSTTSEALPPQTRIAAASTPSRAPRTTEIRGRGPSCARRPTTGTALCDRLRRDARAPHGSSDPVRGQQAGGDWR